MCKCQIVRNTIAKRQTREKKAKTKQKQEKEKKIQFMPQAYKQT